MHRLVGTAIPASPVVLTAAVGTGGSRTKCQGHRQCYVGVRCCGCVAARDVSGTVSGYVPVRGQGLLLRRFAGFVAVVSVLAVLMAGCSVDRWTGGPDVWGTVQCWDDAYAERWGEDAGSVYEHLTGEPTPITTEVKLWAVYSCGVPSGTALDGKVVCAASSLVRQTWPDIGEAARIWQAIDGAGSELGDRAKAEHEAQRCNIPYSELAKSVPLDIDMMLGDAELPATTTTNPQ